MSTIDRWVMAVSSDLGLEHGAADTRLVLDLTSDVAHEVDRPAAPVTAYLVGIAVGRGMSPAAAASKVRELAGNWAGRSGEDDA